MNMKNNNQGFISVLILIVFIAAAVAGGATYYIYTNKKSSTIPKSTITDTPQKNIEKNISISSPSSAMPTTTPLKIKEFDVSANANTKASLQELGPKDAYLFIKNEISKMKDYNELVSIQLKIGVISKKEYDEAMQVTPDVKKFIFNTLKSTPFPDKDKIEIIGQNANTAILNAISTAGRVMIGEITMNFKNGIWNIGKESWKFPPRKPIQTTDSAIEGWKDIYDPESGVQYSYPLPATVNLYFVSAGSSVGQYSGNSLETYIESSFFKPKNVFKFYSRDIASLKVYIYEVVTSDSRPSMQIYIDFRNGNYTQIIITSKDKLTVESTPKDQDFVYLQSVFEKIVSTIKVK